MSKKKKQSKGQDTVVDKFLQYLEQERDIYGSYESAIDVMIEKEKDLVLKKKLYELKKQYRGR